VLFREEESGGGGGAFRKLADMVDTGSTQRWSLLDRDICLAFESKAVREFAQYYEVRLNAISRSDL